MHSPASNGIDCPHVVASACPEIDHKTRNWGLSLIGKCSRFLGFVEGTDREVAEAAVVDELDLSHKQRKRLAATKWRHIARESQTSHYFCLHTAQVAPASADDPAYAWS